MKSSTGQTEEKKSANQPEEPTSATSTRVMYKRFGTPPASEKSAASVYRGHNRPEAIDSTAPTEPLIHFPDQTYVVAYEFAGITGRFGIGHIAIWDGERYFSYGDNDGGNYALTEEDVEALYLQRDIDTYGAVSKIYIPVGPEFAALRGGSDGLSKRMDDKWKYHEYVTRTHNCAHMVDDYLVNAGLLQKKTTASIILTPNDAAESARHAAKVGVAKHGAIINPTDAKEPPSPNERAAQRRSYLLALQKELVKRGNTLDKCWGGGTHSGIIDLKGKLLDQPLKTLPTEVIEKLYFNVVDILAEKSRSSSIFRKKEAEVFYKKWMEASLDLTQIPTERNVVSLTNPSTAGPTATDDDLGDENAPKSDGLPRSSSFRM